MDYLSAGTKVQRCPSARLIGEVFFSSPLKRDENLRNRDNQAWVSQNQKLNDDCKEYWEDDFMIRFGGSLFSISVYWVLFSENKPAEILQGR